MAPAGGVLAPVVMRALRKAIGSTAKFSRTMQSKLSQPLGRDVQHQVQHVTVRATGRQPIHPAAALRQSKRGVRWSSSTRAVTYNRLNAAVRRFISTTVKSALRPTNVDRAAFQNTHVGRAFAQFPGRTPFAHTLRPNLTGGALPRTAGGYAMPGAGGRVGGQRYFSHGPTAPAQVVQNVSQAMRAFWLSGQRAHFDGYDTRGEKTYRPVSVLQASAGRKMASLPRFVPGSFIDFNVSPVVTALSPLGAVAVSGSAASADNKATLNAEDFLDVLATDFARQRKALASVMRDLERLAALGDLPVTLEKHNTLLRVRFPGLDAETVERLCEDIGLQGGLIRQDADFVEDQFDSDRSGSVAEAALRFPFAPEEDDEAAMFTCPPAVTGGSPLHSETLSSLLEDEDEAFLGEYFDENPWLSTPAPASEEGYESMSPPAPAPRSHVSSSSKEDLDEGLEGIYRFLEECDRLVPPPRSTTNY